ncbi:MAG: hypothetical protein NZM09_07555 [Ignavibacterium sp.]|nr:hypothetical protein [Ignavibacterium sp.]MCX7610657.1 hypothetical protein [Ignavibacterium sp.]MDW8375539.1 hypothetical protein [Ignavibacteriales bacterium]
MIIDKNVIKNLIIIPPKTINKNDLSDLFIPRFIATKPMRKLIKEIKNPKINEIKIGLLIKLKKYAVIITRVNKVGR